MQDRCTHTNLPLGNLCREEFESILVESLQSSPLDKFKIVIGEFKGIKWTEYKAINTQPISVQYFPGLVFGM